MIKICKIVCIALVAVPAIAAAADEYGCDRVNFSEEVVAKFPNAARGCRGVTMRDNEAYVQYRVEVVAAGKETVTVHVLGKDDKGISKVKFAPKEGATINIDGKKTPYSKLKEGTQMDLYMSHDRWGLYADPASTPMNIISREDL